MMKDKAWELARGVIQGVPICDAKEFVILLKGSEKTTKGSNMEVEKQNSIF